MTSEKEIEQTMVAVKKDLTSIEQEASAIKVTNDKEMATASEFLGVIKARVKRVEAKRVEYVKPFNDQVKKINADFKEMAWPYLAVEKNIKGKVGAYVDVKLAEEREEQRKADDKRRKEAEALAKKENISNRKALAQVEKVKVEEKPKSVKTEVGRVNTRQVKKFEVVDPSKVPDEYKMVDERLVRKAIADGKKRIAGVKIWEETQVSAS